MDRETDGTDVQQGLSGAASASRDPAPPTLDGLTPGALARALMRRANTASLSTSMAGGEWPYGSLVQVATAPDGAPLLLISTLAQHTTNLQTEPKASLLFDGTGTFDAPLEGPRVGVLGTLAPTTDPADRARYLSRFPDAAGYAGFTDFSFYRMSVRRAHLVAGFGRIHWIEPTDLVLDGETCRRLADGEAGMVAHMNEDHADALDAYAAGLLGLTGTGWRMVGVDPEGLDLRNGGRLARVDFPSPVRTPAEARKMLVALVDRARSDLQAGQARPG